MNRAEWHLTLIDADRIQEYVMGAKKLKLIRGASALQRDLNFEHLLEPLAGGGYGPGNAKRAAAGFAIEERALENDEWQRWEVIYAAGGNLLVLFRDGEQARRYGREAEELFVEKTGSATATAVTVGWKGGFQATREAAYEALQMRKSARSRPASALSCAYGKVCEACGLLFAAAWEAQGFLCVACERRLKEAEKAPYLETVNSKLVAAGSFEELAAGAKPANYLAYVALDVDKLGDFFERLEGENRPELRQWSGKVRGDLEQAVIAGCRQISEGAAEGEKAPFEVLLLGGDDAVVVMQGQLAFGFVRAMEENFRIEGLSFSVGIVWANRSYPITQFAAQGKQLLRSAKRAGGGRVDWAIVTDALSREVGERDGRATRKPYRMEEFLELEGTVRSWKKSGFPANKAKDLYRLAYEGTEQAELEYLFLLSRLKTGPNENHRRMLVNAMPRFWEEDADGIRTKAADLAELWDFVEG